VRRSAARSHQGQNPGAHEKQKALGDHWLAPVSLVGAYLEVTALAAIRFDAAGLPALAARHYAA
jgi:hypothetical protein